MKDYKAVAHLGIVLASMIVSDAAKAQSGGVPDTATPDPVTTPGPSSQTGAVVESGTGTPVDSDNPDNSRLEDIVVTARKRARAEALQDTPITANAFSGEQLAKNAAVNLQDVGRLTPGVSLQQSNQKGQQNFNIRGIGTSGSASTDEPTVGVIQDGVFFADKAGSLGELFDVESISVIRGPQGTLFGRNVTGGAIIVETRRPDFEPSAHAGLAYGNHDTRFASLVLNSPIVTDAVAARVGVLYRQTDGPYRSDRFGSYGEEQVWLVRPSLLIKPTDRLDITLRGEFYSISGDASPTRGIVPGTVPNAVISLPQRDGYVMPEYYYTINADRGFTNIRIYFAAVQFDWEVGGGVLTSVTGVRRVKVGTDGDFDGTPTLGFRTQSKHRQRQVSSELRYAREIGDFLSFTTGLYFFHQSFRDQFVRTLDRGASISAADQRLKDQDSYAAFTEVDVNFTPQLTLTLGGRYTKETKDAIQAPYGSCSLDHKVCRFNAVRTNTDKNFSPKVALSYEISRDYLVYASATRAFRSGGFALSTAGPLLSPYAAETVTQYEIGTKNDLLDNRLRVNASAYYTNYKDIQRTVVGLDPVFGVTQSTFNAASAKIKGFEISANAQVTEWFRLDAVYGYTHARFTEFLNVAKPSALRFTRAPANTGSVSANLTHQLTSGATIEASGGVSFTGKYFYDDQNTQLQKAYSIIDATLVFRPASKNFSVTLYGKNLQNTEYANFGSYLGSRGQNQFPGQPRSYGIRLGADF